MVQFNRAPGGWTVLTRAGSAPSLTDVWAGGGNQEDMRRYTWRSHPRKASQNLGCVDKIERAPSVGGAPLEMPLGQLRCKVSTKKPSFSQTLMLILL
jgi:hypothetical protein